MGKVLTMFGKSDETALDLLQKYNNEKSVVANTDTEYLMVISKHPYDIGGMSTDRNWKSCMNLRGGEDRHYVEIDIELGTIISYLVEKNDKNIQDPVSRILIKPYINEDDQDDILYGIERDSVKYGRDNEKYVKKLISVLDKAQEEKTGIFDIDKNLYDDDGLLQIAKINAKKIKEIENKIGSQIKELKDGLTFEIIVKKFPWLYRQNVVFKDAVLGTNGEDLKWYDGIWKNGTWQYGLWYNGIWEDGFWVNGLWKKGVWKNGTWKKGDWENGTWEKGSWLNGTWSNGTWESGRWERGVWYNGTWQYGLWYNGIWEDGFWVNGLWKKGVWKNGTWKKGDWENGTWEKGSWLNGTWSNGTWESGNWHTGVWKGGVWKSGLIWDEEESEYIESNTPPK